MYIIAGLGNPGLKYRHTRHNAGFEAIDALAKAYGISIRKKEQNGLTGTGVIDGEKVLLVKPQTYMNNSGECVGPLADYYGVAPDHVIIFSDDVELDCGRLRIRRKGSSGGHNGLKSLIRHLRTEEFPRVRIGVGKVQPGDDLLTHVLIKPTKEDQKKIHEAIGNIPECVSLMVHGNIDEAMHRFN